MKIKLQNRKITGISKIKKLDGQNTDIKYVQ